MLKPIIAILRFIRMLIMGERSVNEEIRHCVRGIGRFADEYKQYQFHDEDHYLLEKIANKLEELKDLIGEKDEC